MANKFQAVGMFCFLISFLIWRTIFVNGTLQAPWIILEIPAGLLAFSLCVVGTIYLIVASQAFSEHGTILSTLGHFCFMYLPLLQGRRRLAVIRASCTTPRKAQEECLSCIVTSNKDTEYGRESGLGDINCLKDLQTKHPLTSYKDYEQYVQRIADGEANVMTTAKLTRLVLTSGTTGASKFIPMDMERYYYNIMTTIPVLFETFPDLQPMQKFFRLHCNARVRKSKSGLTIAGVMILEQDLTRYMLIYSTPPDGLLIEDKEVAFYVNFLFGLRERNVGLAMALFSSMLVDGFEYLENHWPRLVEDLAHGTLNRDLNIPASTRESLTKALGPGDPKRAEEVRKECQKGQQGIMRRLWPKLKCIAVTDNTGIRDRIMKTIAEGVPTFSPVYSCSEHLLGINIDPLQQGQEQFLLMIADVVYEFIPEDDIGSANPRTYLIDEVELGKNYELVITQMYGLYRYRMGDVVQVSGFYRNCPQVKFMYRTGTLLNLFGEKVDQVTLRTSLTSALSGWIDVGALRHYWVAESTLLAGSLPEKEGSRDTSSHYVLFLDIDHSDRRHGDSTAIDLTELAQSGTSDKAASQTRDQNANQITTRFQIDENIYSRHSFYRVFKDNGSIAPSVVHLVETGAADQLKAHILANSSATEIQFKMPEKIRTREMAEVMIRNICE